MVLMYLTFTIVGVGYGLSYTSTATIISFYFKKRRSLANGIVVSSASIAVLSLPFLYRFIIDKYGFSPAFWIIGAILSNICVASCVYRQPKSLQNDQDICLCDNNLTHSGRHGEDKSMKMCYGTLNLKFSLFKNRRFTLFVIAFTLCTIGHINNYILIPAHIKALGYNSTYVTIGVSISGVAELIARIVIGWFADLNVIAKINIFVICTFVGGIFALMSPLFETFTFMSVYAGVVGAFPASTIGLLPVLVIERVGIDNFKPAFAVISVFLALASIISFPISGWLAENYGNWYPSFMFTGITLICAGVTALVENVIRRFSILNKRRSLEKGKINSAQNDKTASFEDVHIKLVSQVKCAQADVDDTKKKMFKN